MDETDFFRTIGERKNRCCKYLQMLPIQLLPFSSTLITPPPPLELKKKFSDGFRWFEFEWVISGQILKIDLALKSRFTRENIRFSKTFQTGLGVLSSRGGGVIKVDENGKFQKKGKTLQTASFSRYEFICNPNHKLSIHEIGKLKMNIRNRFKIIHSCFNRKKFLGGISQPT